MRSRNIRLATLASLVIVVAVSLPMGAATRTWSSAPPTSNWATSSNWVGFLTPANGDNVVFPFSSKLATTNDFAPGLALTGISITEPGYAISGNSINISGNVEYTTAGSSPSTISLPLNQVGGLFIKGDDTQFLNIGNLQANVGNGALTIENKVSINGTLSGLNGITILGTASTYVNLVGGSSSYGGTITVASGGSLRVVGDYLLGNGTVSASAGSNLYLAHGSKFSFVNSGTNLRIGESTSGGTNSGQFQVTNLNLTGGAYTVDINGLTVGSGYDQLYVQDGYTINSANTALTIRKAGGFDPPGGTVFEILKVDLNTCQICNASGTFMNAPNGSIINVGGVDFKVVYTGFGVNLEVPSKSRTWKGFVGGGAQPWSNTGAWVEGSIPVAGSDLTFPAGALTTTPVNDLAAGFIIKNIVISGPGYQLSGNRITLSNGIALGGANSGPATISMPITFSGAQTVVSSKALTFTGPLQLNNAVTLTGPITITGALSGPASLLVQGSGTVADVQTTSTGTGTIQAQVSGRLRFNGSHKGPLSVQSDSKMDVTGSATQILASGQLYVGGENSAGNATAPTITLGSSATAHMDILGVNSYDTLTGTTITLGNATLALKPGQRPPEPGSVYRIVNNTSTSPISGTFKSLPEGATITLDGRKMTISYKGGTGNDVVLTTENICNVTIGAPTSVRPNSSGNIAGVIDPPTGATFKWSVSNGSITAGQGASRIAFTAGSTGVVRITVEIGGSCTGTGDQSASIDPTPASVILSSTPRAILLAAGSGAGGAATYALTNIGDTPTTVTLGQSGNFFTQSPASFSLGAGASQTVTINVPPQANTGASTGYSRPQGTGVPEGLSVPVTLLVAAPPSSGTPNVIAAIDRIDVSSARGQSGRGTATFRNIGTAMAVGIPSSNVPWIIPDPTGVVSIPPGGSVSLGLTIDRTQRPDRSSPRGSVLGTLSFIYAAPVPASRQTHDAPSLAVSIPVSDTVKPSTSQTAIPPLAQGEVALLVPGAGNVVGSGGKLFLSNMTLLNKSLFGSLPDAKVYYIPPTGQATEAAVDTLNAGGSLNLANVVTTVFNQSQQIGTLMIRTSQVEDVVVAATILNDNNPKGRYGMVLPVLRSDTAAGPGQRLVINGVKFDSSTHTNMYVQEMSGKATSATLRFYKADGTPAAPPVLLTVEPFALARLPWVVPEGAVTAVVTNDKGGKLLSYATPVDDATGGGDTWAQTDWNRLSSLSGSEPVLIPVARAGAGENGSYLRTDVAITNTGNANASVKLRYTAGGAVVEKNVNNLAPLATAVLGDVVAGLLGVTPPSVGSLVVTPLSGSFAVTSRTYATAPGSAATFGSAVPTVPLTSALQPGQSRMIAGLEDSRGITVNANTPRTARTEFGLVETTGQAATVKISLFLNDGRSLAFGAARGSITLNLNPNEVRIVPDLAKAVLGDARETQFGDLTDVMVRFDVIGGSGSVVPFVTSTDNGSEDTIFRNE